MGLKPRLVRLAGAAVLLGVAGYYAFWGGEYSVPDLWRLKREIAAEQVKLDRTVAEADSLEAVAKLLAEDPRELERVARERFGMIRDGELLVRFVRVDTGAAARLAGRP
ncbi:hypothetical protein BH23GEM4_BH23GEM4_23390 [soil metagenome]